MTIELTEEAVNCLKRWQMHGMYPDDLSGVILQQMSEWLCRDMWSASQAEIAAEFTAIKEGLYND